MSKNYHGFLSKRALARMKKRAQKDPPLQSKDGRVLVRNFTDEEKKQKGLAKAKKGLGKVRVATRPKKFVKGKSFRVVDSDKLHKKLEHKYGLEYVRVKGPSIIVSEILKHSGETVVISSSPKGVVLRTVDGDEIIQSDDQNIVVEAIKGIEETKHMKMRAHNILFE